VRGAAEGAGLGNAFLSHIAAVDGIFHVVRAFDSDEVRGVFRRKGGAGRGAGAAAGEGVGEGAAGPEGPGGAGRGRGGGQGGGGGRRSPAGTPRRVRAPKPSTPAPGP
jgi:hypothetical protein